MEIRINASPHPGQAAVHGDPARFKVLAAGRRWGKTRLGVNECLDTAAHGGRAWWVAPSYKMSEVGWRPIHRMGVQIGADIGKVDRQVTLPGGGWVQVRSADNPDSLRGEGLDFVVMDECAFMHEAAWTEAIRPALSDREGKALFISTPSGRNWFWRLWMLGQSGDDPEWRSWSFPTKANPYIAPGEIDAAQRSLPERIFQQEYLAQFLENEGTVFRNIAACLHDDGDTPDDHRGHRVVMGVDWGQSIDFTVLSVVCADCCKELALDRFHGMAYPEQRARLASVARTWGVSYILAESNAMGRPNIEDLQRADLPVSGFETTATTKPPLIESLALAFEREEVRWLDIAVATLEAEAYERSVNAHTGRPRYSAPEGVHDDTVMARALANKALGYAGAWVQVI